MYKFRVYHRNAVKEDPETGKLVLDRNEFEQFIGRSVGHSIVALYDGTTERARGLYPNNKYKDEAESIELAKEYQEQHPNEKVFYVIEFDLTKEEYEGAWNVMKKFEPYVGEEIPKEVLGGMYIILGNNCADLSNTVYRGTGLPGNFTYQMTTQQLDKAPGAVAWYVKTFGVGDKPHKVPSDLSLEEFAAEWRIPVSSLSVAKNNGPVVKPNPSVLSTQPKHVYTIAPNPKLVASPASEEEQINENFAQLAVTEEERESKVKSIIEAAIRAFKEKFEAIRDKFNDKYLENLIKSMLEARTSAESGKAEDETEEQSIHQKNKQEIEALRTQLQSSYESDKSAIQGRMQGEINAFCQQKKAEFAIICAAVEAEGGRADAGPLNAEIIAFQNKKTDEAQAENKALYEKVQSQLKSFIAAKEAEAEKQCNEIKSSREQKLKSTESKIHEIEDTAKNKEKAQEEKCDRKIKDIQEDTSLIERLKEVVGNSGDASAEAIINEELNVVLQGAASDFGVDAVNL